MHTNRCRIASFVVSAMLASIAPAHAQFVPRYVQARWTDTPPVINGDLADAVWNRAQVIDEFYAYKSGGDPAAADATARVLWDDSNLYVAFQMFEVDIRSSCDLARQCGHDANLFDGDVIELFVKELPGTSTYFELEWSPIGDTFDAQFDSRFGPPGTSFESSLTSAVQVDGTVDNGADTDRSWSVEASIPLESLSAFSSVDGGTEWFFTVARYDYHNAPPSPLEALMMSTPGDPNAPMGGVTHGFHTYEIYDILQFTLAPDFNGDRRFDCIDVDSLVMEIVAGTNNAAFDLTGDGMVDLGDLDEWRAFVGAANLPSGNSYLRGDANLDGSVDVRDFNVWNDNKFTVTAAWCSGDFNADGDVDEQDLNIWNEHKFTPSDVRTAVPEPAAGAFFILALIAFVRRVDFAFLERSEK